MTLRGSLDYSISFTAKDRIPNIYDHWITRDLFAYIDIARGDRRLNDVILQAYQDGCFYDAWSEYFHYDRWQKAMEDHGLTMAFYNGRTRDEDELFPWDFIDIGVTKEFMLREYKRSLAEEVTPNCRAKCAGCGAAKFGCGVCVEARN